MEKQYIFFNSSISLAILFAGIAILFGGIVWLASIAPGNFIVTTIFIAIVSIAIVGIAYKFDEKKRK
ncbi:MAG: hypothetical protein KZQ76_08645 [Candidatus Thiodiazotropha sp. (ex Epidulcina cf. delphinae)]|nr:hypothetical protein [Candidatus Thiodiazotropha sp. (ex Epidulcina cf. delphinae)]